MAKNRRKNKTHLRSNDQSNTQIDNESDVEHNLEDERTDEKSEKLFSSSVLMDHLNKIRNINEEILKWNSTDVIDIRTNRKLHGKINLDTIRQSISRSPFCKYLKPQPLDLKQTSAAALCGVVIKSNSGDLNENDNSTVHGEIDGKSNKENVVVEIPVNSTETGVHSHESSEKTDTSLSPSNVRSSGRSVKKNYLDMLSCPELEWRRSPAASGVDGTMKSERRASSKKSNESPSSVEKRRRNSKGQLNSSFNEKTEELENCQFEVKEESKNGIIGKVDDERLYDSPNVKEEDAPIIALFEKSSRRSHKSGSSVSSLRSDVSRKCSICSGKLLNSADLSGVCHECNAQKLAGGKVEQSIQSADDLVCVWTPPCWSVTRSSNVMCNACSLQSLMERGVSVGSDYDGLTLAELRDEQRISTVRQSLIGELQRLLNTYKDIASPEQSCLLPDRASLRTDCTWDARRFRRRPESQSCDVCQQNKQPIVYSVLPDGTATICHDCLLVAHDSFRSIATLAVPCGKLDSCRNCLLYRFVSICQRESVEHRSSDGPCKLCRRKAVVPVIVLASGVCLCVVCIWTTKLVILRADDRCPGGNCDIDECQRCLADLAAKVAPIEEILSSAIRPVQTDVAVDDNNSTATTNERLSSDTSLETQRAEENCWGNELLDEIAAHDKRHDAARPVTVPQRYRESSKFVDMIKRKNPKGKRKDELRKQRRLENKKQAVTVESQRAIKRKERISLTNSDGMPIKKPKRNPLNIDANWHQPESRSRRMVKPPKFSDFIVLEKDIKHALQIGGRRRNSDKWTEEEADNNDGGGDKEQEPAEEEQQADDTPPPKGMNNSTESAMDLDDAVPPAPMSSTDDEIGGTFRRIKRAQSPIVTATTTVPSEVESTAVAGGDTRQGGPRVKQVSRQNVSPLDLAGTGIGQNEPNNRRTECGCRGCLRNRVCGRCEACLMNRRTRTTAEMCMKMVCIRNGMSVVHDDDFNAAAEGAGLKLDELRIQRRAVEVYRDSDSDDNDNSINRNDSDDDEMDLESDRIYPVKGESISIELAHEGGYPIVTSRRAQPHTVVCYSCGSGGDQMINCVCCAEPFHFFCIEYQFRPKSKEMFVCRNCTKCRICDEYGCDLRCIKCQLGYHPRCIGRYPPASGDDRSNWACYCCSMCLHCGARADDLMTANNNGTAAAQIDWSDDPWQCGKCCRARNSGHICPECGRAYLTNLDNIECCQCGKFVHRQCAGLTEDEYAILQIGNPHSDSFVCSQCAAPQPDNTDDDARRRVPPKRLSKESAMKIFCGQAVNRRMSEFIERADEVEDGLLGQLDASAAGGNGQSIVRVLQQLDGVMDDDDDEIAVTAAAPFPSGVDGECLNSSDSVVDEYDDDAFASSPHHDSIDIDRPPMGIFTKLSADQFLTSTHLLTDTLARIILRLRRHPTDGQLSMVYDRLRGFMAELAADLFPWVDFHLCYDTAQDIVRQYAGRARLVLRYIDDVTRLGLRKELDVFSTSIWDMEEKLLSSFQRGRDEFILFHTLKRSMENQQFRDGHFARYLVAAEKPEDVKPMLEKDVRQCALCRQSGDDGIEGRLIYGGMDVWIHVNCALWSDEVYEKEDGELVNVDGAIRRGWRTSCDSCSSLGATVRCSGCANCYHFGCAFHALSARIFTESLTFYCTDEHSRNDSTSRPLGLEDMLILRRIYLPLGYAADPDLPTGTRELTAEDVVVTIGNLRIDQLGTVDDRSDCARLLLCPLEFRARRLFWSHLEVDTLVMYYMCIEKDSVVGTVGQKRQTDESGVPVRKYKKENGGETTKTTKRRAPPAQLPPVQEIVYEMDEFGNLQPTVDKSSEFAAHEEEPKTRRCRTGLILNSNRVNRRFPKDSVLRTANPDADIPRRIVPVGCFHGQRWLTGLKENADVVAAVRQTQPQQAQINPSKIVESPLQPELKLPDEELPIVSQPNEDSIPPQVPLSPASISIPPTHPPVMQQHTIVLNQPQPIIINSGSLMQSPVARPAPTIIRIPSMSSSAAVLPNQVRPRIVKIMKIQSMASVVQKDQQSLSTMRMSPSIPIVKIINNNRPVADTNVLRSVLTTTDPGRPVPLQSFIVANRSLPTNTFGYQFDGEADECASECKKGPSSVGSDQDNGTVITNGKSTKKADRPGVKFTIRGFFSNRSPRSNWTYLIRKVRQLRETVKFDYPLRSGDGWAKYGLDHRHVIYLIEQLPGAFLCRQYDFKFHKGLVTKRRERHAMQTRTPVELARFAPWTQTVEAHIARDPLDFLNCKSNRAPRCHAPMDAGTALEMMPEPDSGYMQRLAVQVRALTNGAAARAHAVAVCVSSIHGRGLFARRPFAAHEVIIEYVGEIIRSMLSDMREARYQRTGVDCYMFRLDQDLIVDATYRGNAARFINHSCQPNCYAKVVRFEGEKHIIIIAQRTIFKGEELTYDYRFPIEDDKLPCTCGSFKCRKYLN